MIYKKYRFNIVIRLLLITATIYLFVYMLESRFFLTPVLIAILVLLQLIYLFRYIDKTNRDLASFLESIRFSEFTRSFKIEGLGSSFDELSRAFNDVIKDFQIIRAEKEEHYQYLHSIVENTDVSIIGFQKNGTVELINKAAKKLLQITSLKNIQSLEHLSKEFVDTLLNLKPGVVDLVKVQDEDDILQLAVSSSEVKIKNKLIILATIKNIQSVLEEQETQAWQKLIRVLTHEIMNSITPIASITSTLEMMLNSITKDSDHSTYHIDPEDLQEFKQALRTIGKRSNGLMHFVNTYRNLTRIPKPNFKIIKIIDIFKEIKSLMLKEIKGKNIDFSCPVYPANLELFADEKLIEQVLINLVKNSIHAVESQENPKITMKAYKNKRGRITIHVIDNGHGILPDVLDKIFIPFFTTKPKGSGIGLSLSREILRLHGGSLYAHSTPEKETTFTLTF